MIKKLFFRNRLVLAPLLVPNLMSADNRDEDSLRTAQHDLKEYDWVDICIGNPKYAIVTKGLILHSWHGCITRRAGWDMQLRRPSSEGILDPSTQICQ